jgi:tripartite-type tricarboxylate transporter receptor subunit TctC
MIKFALKFTLAATLAAIGLPATAQNYPARPVRVIVPWPAGGSIDAAARVASQRLSSALGGSFVVDNRAGAAGTIGADSVAKAPADGYTLMVHSATHVANATTYAKLPYRTLEDFTPIAFLSAQPACWSRILRCR